MNKQPRVRCDCNRSFATASALAQHQKDSPRHQNNPQANNTPNDAVPTLISEGVTTPVAAIAPTSTTNASSAPAPDKKPSTSQKKRNKKNSKNGKKPQTSTSSGYSTFNPRPSYGYCTQGEGLGYYSTPMYMTWEDEYKMGGPDHTQCTSDCDWCGMCVYRDPY
ncbi:hypothetical protein F4860DRAFT_206104 [Xylaria cubensis]|nr:hypothetical protein F4860DRAFT_206104 [Xylaria cubensis]